MDHLTPEQRAEVDVAVHKAYVDDSGDIRGHAEAAAEFDQLLAQAVQDQRAWAGVLLDMWRYAGMKQFIRDRWKTLKGRFEYPHKGRIRSRTMRRGTRVRDAGTGQERWVQDELLMFTTDRLNRAILECTRRIEEERANIVMYRSLLDLLEDTGCATVGAALAEREQTLEEYLAEQAA